MAKDDYIAFEAFLEKNKEKFPEPADSEDPYVVTDPSVKHWVDLYYCFSDETKERINQLIDEVRENA